MSRLDRYIVGRWFGWFVPSAAVLVAVYLSGDVAFLLWDLIAQGLPLSTIAFSFLLKLPTILYQMAPVASLLATLLALTRLKRQGEMGAILCTGTSGLRLARPILLCALAVCAAAYYVNETLAPPANRLIQDIVRGDRLSEQRLVGTDRIWLIEEARVIFISSVEDRGRTLRQPTVLEFSGEGLRRLGSRLDAASARWENGRWVAQDGIRRTFAGDERVATQEAFSSADLPILVKPDEFFRVRRAPEEMSRAELSRYVENLRRAGLPFERYAVRVYRREAAALVPLVFTVLAIPVAFLVPIRGGAAAGIGLSILLSMLFWSVFSFAQSLGFSGVIPAPAAAWSAVVLFLAIGLAAMAGVRRVRLT